MFMVEGVKRSRLPVFLIIFMLLSLQVPSSSAKILYIPNSEKHVLIDGDVQQDEWRDAYHIVFDSLDGGSVDVYMKYDRPKELLLCGFIIDDSTPDPEDIFLLGVDRDSSGGAYPQKDDYLLSIFRESYYLSIDFHIDTTLGEGTGTGWELYDNFDANIRYFRGPFKDFVWSRKEVSRAGPVEDETWSGEFSLFLAGGSATGSGSVNQGLAMGFMIGYEDTQGEGDHKFYFYGIGELPDSGDTLTPAPPSLWTTVYLYAPLPNTWFQDPPTLTSIDVSSLEVLTNPKVLKLSMYEDPAGTAKFIKDSAKEYVLNMVKFLVKSSSWADSLPLTGELENEAEIREVLNTMIGTQQASVASILENSRPYEAPSSGASIQALEDIQNIFTGITTRGTVTVDDLKQNADDIKEARLKFSPLLGGFLGVGGDLSYVVDVAVTLSSSNDPADVFEFDQTVTEITAAFQVCSQLLKAIDQVNRELIDLIED